MTSERVVGAREESGRVVLFSFLGLTRYTPVRYHLESTPDQSSSVETYVQAALYDLLPVKPTHILVAMTRAVRQSQQTPRVIKDVPTPPPWEFASRFDDIPIEPIVPLRPEETDLIDDPTTEQAVWGVFRWIGEHFQSGDRVVFDLTHGFRSLPMVGALALLYLRQAKNITVEGVYYGAFEHLGSPESVKARLARDEDPGSAPILDLTPMLGLPSWTEAMSLWQRNGRASAAVSLMKPYLDGLKQSLRREAPAELVALPSNLSLVDDALTILRHDRIGSTSRALVESLDKARSQLAGHDDLTPLAPFLDALSADAASLVGSADGWTYGASAYLEHQRRIALWFVEHGRLVEACSLLRELVTSVAVRIAKEAGVEELRMPDRSGSGSRSVASDLGAFRKDVDWIISTLSGAEEAAKTPNHVDAAAVDRIESWLETRPAVAELYAHALKNIRTTRNQIDHCWVGREHSIVGFSRTSREEITRRVRLVQGALGELIAAVDPSLAAPRSAAGRAESSFANISNHPLSTWSKEQSAAAIALGHGPLVDFPCEEVDPDATEEDLTDQAAALAETISERGVTGAHVATDFTFAYALVNALRARGVRCYGGSAEQPARDYE